MVSAPPTPSKIPAIGRRAIGNIKAFPTFCNVVNIDPDDVDITSPPLNCY
ncbi:hypothetical protein BHY_1363 (plasmid) [Borrelia nietonii YOR]|uniref:Uncharacterized protein n=1 Tax=Borrelia nietonii YOR TaxID=1293576 RepID=W5SB44_9SPIR|nr:hypothetical protein BHY_1363 [Borrelia nietonii YOR]